MAVSTVHYAWVGPFPEHDPAQDRWASVAGPVATPWLPRYTETQSYWPGFSSALSLTFAATALRRYREKRLCAARNLAIGGVTLSGFLAVAAASSSGATSRPCWPSSSPSSAQGSSRLPNRSWRC